MMATNESPVVLVVGAAGGTGAALCRRLKARGVTLVMSGRNVAALDALSAELGGDVMPLDARDIAATGAVVDAVVAKYGGLHGAVNLAGSIVLKAAHATSEQEWLDMIATNLTTAFSLVRAAAPAIAKSGGGSLVLMSSAAARLGLANHDAIAATKAGVQGLALSSAATYAPRGVRINVVAPGLVRTPLAARLVNNEASLKASESMHALGRIGEPEDVASMIDWLLDAKQGWVTGQVFGVDGGLATLRAR